MVDENGDENEEECISTLGLVFCLKFEGKELVIVMEFLYVHLMQLHSNEYSLFGVRTSLMAIHTSLSTLISMVFLSFSIGFHHENIITQQTF